MNQDPESWTREEADALRELATPARPRASLERRVLEQLESEGEIRAPRASHRWLRPSLAIAASLLLFLAGIEVGERRATARAPAPGAETYMALLFEDASFDAAPPGQQAERVDEYRRWGQSVRDQGVAVVGDELTGDIRLIEPRGDEVEVVPGQLDSRFGRLAGYFLLDARDGEQALALASTMPHLRYGGRVALVRLAGH